MLNRKRLFDSLASAGGALLLSALFVLAAVGPAEVGTRAPVETGSHARLA